MILTVVSFIIMGVGLTVMLFGIIGTLVFPDFLTRAHAATKCGITGTTTTLLGFILYAAELSFSMKLGIILLFLFFTGPLTAHIIAFSFGKDKFFPSEK